VLLEVAVVHDHHSHEHTHADNHRLRIDKAGAAAFTVQIFFFMPHRSSSAARLVLEFVVAAVEAFEVVKVAGDCPWWHYDNIYCNMNTKAYLLERSWTQPQPQT
jgi:hypothetical protein